ncbi:hypothetical protein DBV15_00138 [Temnothorax longispinosus]|uniref:Uncharacterized protein n=1 Tax=Temnothorax longispinosus TaxID=300112 RepID=A0A4S2KIB7_9HYME|nr:hypothetical protein DBV15_00138 [Temnothorax longispinosus]
MSKESESFEAASRDESRVPYTEDELTSGGGEGKKKKKEFSAFRIYVHATMNVMLRESKSFEALPATRRKRRRTEIKRRGARERERKRVKAESRSAASGARGRASERGARDEGGREEEEEEEGIGELCLHQGCTGDAIKLLVHNSAARSEAAATALKSELVLRPPRVPSRPPPFATLPPCRRLPCLSFLVVASVESRARLNDSSGTIRGFLVCGPTRRGGEGRGRTKRARGRGRTVEYLFGGTRSGIISSGSDGAANAKRNEARFENEERKKREKKRGGANGDEKQENGRRAKDFRRGSKNTENAPKRAARGARSRNEVGERDGESERKAVVARGLGERARETAGADRVYARKAPLDSRDDASPADESGAPRHAAPRRDRIERIPRSLGSLGSIGEPALLISIFNEGFATPRARARATKIEKKEADLQGARGPRFLVRSRAAFLPDSAGRKFSRGTRTSIARRAGDRGGGGEEMERKREEEEGKRERKRKKSAMSREAAGGGLWPTQRTVGISRDVRFDGTSGKKSGCAKSELGGTERCCGARGRGRERERERERKRSRQSAHSHVVTVPDNWLGSRARVHEIFPRLRFRWFADACLEIVIGVSIPSVFESSLSNRHKFDIHQTPKKPTTKSGLLPGEKPGPFGSSDLDEIYARVTRVLTYQDFERRNSAEGESGTPGEGPRLREASGERTHEGPPKVLVRHKQSDRGLWFRHSSGAAELWRAEEGEGMAEGQGEDGPGSVGDSGATPIIVVVVLDDGGGRWKRWSGQEEEEEEEEQRGGGRGGGGG